VRVKTFEAASMQDALVTIKQEMGEDAYILSTKTRRPAKPGGTPVIEVTAAVDDSGVQPTAAAQGDRPGGTYGLRSPLSVTPTQSDGASKGQGGHKTGAHRHHGGQAQPPAKPAGSNGSKTAEAAQGITLTLPKEPARRVVETLNVPAPEPEPAPWAHGSRRSHTPTPTEAKPEVMPQRASDEPMMDLQPIRRELLEIRGAVEALKEQDSRNSAVLAELDQLKGMLSRLQKHGLPALPHQLPPALLRLYGDLAANDVDPMIAVRLCEYTQRALAEQGGEENMAHDKARLYMRRVISDFIPVASPIQLDPAKAQVAALVGPAGAGKTSTIAKLAAFAKQNLQQKAALITLDVFRAGAADQLQQHASDLHVPIHVCITSEDLKSALKFYQDKALVLIDTPGLRQQDAARMEKLASLLDDVRLAETHLVLPATSKPRDLAEIAQRFERLRPTRLLFTKLDETCTHGPILSTLVRVKKPLSYLGTGQEIPQDLELATSRRVADLILPPTQVQP